MKIYKFHRYSKTCRKYRSEYCRFHLGKFFTNRTIIAQPFSDSLSVDEKNEIMGSRKLLLKKVKQYIDTELNPSKKILTASQGMSMKKLRQLINSWNFWEFLSLIMSKNCQILMIQIFKYTTENQLTHVL